MTERQDEMARLDALFAEVRDRPVEAGGDFLARLEAAALAEQPRPRPAAADDCPASRPAAAGWFGALGGWPALGGLAAATVAGFWIGVAPPAPVLALLGGTEAVELLPGADLVALIEEAGA